MNDAVRFSRQVTVDSSILRVYGSIFLPATHGGHEGGGKSEEQLVSTKLGGRMSCILDP